MDVKNIMFADLLAMRQQRLHCFTVKVWAQVARVFHMMADIEHGRVGHLIIKLSALCEVVALFSLLD